jgi:hypothetical protein
MNNPSDADGDAIRSVIADGSDVTRPMVVDFHIECPDVTSAEAIASKIPRDEFTVSIDQDTESGAVTCECSKQMLLQYSELTRIQRRLMDIASPFGGRCEAWGTFGNTHKLRHNGSPTFGPTKRLSGSGTGGGPLEWATAEIEYEGFPLMLRHSTNIDIDSLRGAHPALAVITHEFTKRKPNGLPEPEYNESLFQMDMELVRAFDLDQIGVPVLVETFGGKRHYYFYVTEGTVVPAIILAVAQRYPSERLSWTVRSDPQWGFLEKYAKEYF